MTDQEPEEFRVYAIRYARRDGRRGEHFHGYDDRSHEPHPTAYFVWLAVSPRHTVVVDAGIAADRAGRLGGLDYLASPVETLAKMGVTPAAVDHVVLTHLHYDHTGTARAFTTARYVLQRAELDYWTGPWAKRITRQRWLVDDEDVAHLLPFAVLHDLPGMYGAFDRIRALADGDALVVAGHDPEVLDRYPPLSPSLAGLVAVIA